MDMAGFKVYKVGGVVRDTLLGLTPKEVDWVVVGATAAEMLALGFKQVGKDFPVFLHPETNEEYALARTERKIASGHQGFECFSDPGVSLEEDLQRRDLTINAIAQAENGDLIDPFKGQRDIEDKQFRHVSPAFIEDPLRVLRVARFAARLPDFQVHAETLALMKQMVNDGMLQELTPERVWKELGRALTEVAPERFFQVLEQSDALQALWPAMHFDVNALTDFARYQHEVIGRFAILFWGQDPQLVKAFAQQWRVPTAYSSFADMIAKTSDCMGNPMQSPAQLVTFLDQLDVRRKQDQLKLWLDILAQKTSKETAAWYEAALALYFSINEAEISQACAIPQHIKGAIRDHRIQAVAPMFG